MLCDSISHMIIGLINIVMKFKLCLFLTVFVIHSFCQVQAANFTKYDSVSSFTCDSLTLERIELTSECGELLSPCYPDDYPLQISSGVKIWDLEAMLSSATSVPVLGYRFTINFFETDDVGGNLDFSTVLDFQPDTNINVFIERILQLSGNASVEPGLTLRAGEDVQSILQGHFVDLNVSKVFISFYTSRTVARKGFNITYCADFDRCNSDYPTVLCNATRSNCQRNGFSNYSCACLEGYTGEDCNQDIDECTTSVHNCHANATCTNVEGSFTCACNPGFNGDGISCTDINECTDGTHNCSVLAQCINTVGSFDCACNSGFNGDGFNCTDVNECHPDFANGCAYNTSRCDNILGSFSCICLDGYSGNGTNCVDIDECTTGSNDCDTNAICTNIDREFTCACGRGYTGNGTFCSDVNECVTGMNDCHGDAECTNDPPGSYTCSCNNGFSGNGTFCEDNNECVLNMDDCVENSRCTNNRGSYTCACNNGYEGNGLTECTDIDECERGTAGCAIGNGGFCTNNQGSFECGCLDGYEGDGFTCTDIDECANDDDDCAEPPSASCTNTNGSFTCMCSPGYTGNGRSCDDIDECAMDTDNDCNITTGGQKCFNTDGSYECVCNTPEYRGEPSSCMGYYCPGFLHEPGNRNANVCLIEGIIEWPNFYDGRKIYAVMQTVSWYVNLTARAVSPGIRFSFTGLSVERSQDYIIFSESGDVTDPRLAVITGELDNIFNGETPASNSNPEGFDVSARTYTLKERTEIYVHFVSDRMNVGSGFQMNYNADEDDCPATSPCLNGAVCEDDVFDYICRNCVGYEGKNCDTNINECLTDSSNNCHPNAACDDIDGSFICTCDADYTGNGVNCRPLILLSNLIVTPISTRTTASLSISFDLTARWGNNPAYITNYVIMVTNVATGGSFNVTTRPVNATNFLPFVIAVTPLTEYNFTIYPGETGPLYSTATFDTDAASEGVTETSGSTATDPPSDLSVISATEAQVTLNWTNPTQESTGMITEFEVGFQRNGSDCNLYSVLGSQIDCGAERTIKFPSTRRDFAVSGLQQYRTYEFRLRTYTSAGASGWSNVVTTLTGKTCTPSTNREDAISNPCRETQSSLSSENFPNTYRGFTTLYWAIDFRGEGAVKIVFDYFNIENMQDYLDIGQGEIPLEPFNVTNSNIVTRTGNLTRGIDDVLYLENATNNGRIFVRFTADLYNATQGFQIHYETNASRCIPDNPCLSGGTCKATEFDFECTCSSLWTGKVCSDPLVEISATCSSVAADSFRVDWSVTEGWADDETLIKGYNINYAGLSSPVFREIGESSYTANGFSTYELVAVTIEIQSVNSSTTTATTAMVECRTGEAQSSAPNNLTLTATSNSEVRVSFTEPTSLNGMLLGYTIMYSRTDGASDGESDIGSVETTNLVEVISGLRTYREYEFTVYARNGFGNGLVASAPVRTGESVPLEAPGNLNVSITNAREVEITFDPPTTVTGPFTYRVAVEPNIASPPDPSTSSPITVTGLAPNTSYNFTIVAETSAGAGPPAYVVAATPEDIPGPVSALIVGEITAESIAVRWGVPNEPNGVITGYSITWSPDGLTPTDLGLSTSFVITSLDVYTSYSIAVYARTAVGDGESNSLQVETLEGPPVGPVRNVTFTLEATQANLVITPPEIATGEFTYIIEYTLQGSGVTQSINATSTTFSLTGLESFRQYDITVYPQSGGVRGTEAYTFTFTLPSGLPGVVSDVTTSQVTSTSVTVNWQPPAEPNGIITQYRVSWNPATGGGSSPALESGVRSYTVDGLNAYTDYTFSVFARTTEGEGLASTQTARTLEDVPGVVDSLDITAAANVINITFGEPLTTNGEILFYHVQVTQDEADCNTFGDSPCDPFSETIPAADLVIPYTVSGLRPYRIYSVSVFANTSAGNGPPSNLTQQTLPAVPGRIQNIETTSLNDTAISITLVAPSPIVGPVTYVISATGATTTNLTIIETISESTQTTETVTVSNLPSGEEVSITVDVSTSAGEGPQNQTTHYRVNLVVAGAAPSLALDQDEAAGKSAFNIMNPCNNLDTLFTQRGGRAYSVDVIVKEVEAPNTNPTVWSVASTENPIPPYVAGTIICDNAARKKRALNADRTEYQIGSDETCDRSLTNTCNGPLVQGRTYEVALRAENLAQMKSNLTNYGASYTVPVATSTGLEPGEIAAIVICSIIVFLLIILLVVFLVKQRRNSGKHNVTYSGNDNEAFRKGKAKLDATPQQRFEVSTLTADKPADPATSYSQESTLN